MKLLIPVLEPQICEGRALDQPMDPSTKYLLIRGIPSVAGLQLELVMQARKEAWLKKRQDKQQADAVDPSDTSETVSVTDSTVESREVEATEMESNSVPNNVYACDLCDYSTQTEHGHKHKSANITPKKERTSLFNGDLSLNLTPTKEIRVEKCGKCGLEMTPDHQCDIYTADTTTPEKEKKIC